MNINRVLHRLELESNDPWLSSDDYWAKIEAIWLLRFLRTLPDDQIDRVQPYLRHRGLAGQPYENTRREKAC